MSEKLHLCCICAAEADWIRMRKPNREQMSYLCHRHYQSLQQRNPILASYYDALASVSPMQIQPQPKFDEAKKTISEESNASAKPSMTS
jgi:hypothetical protein